VWEEFIFKKSFELSYRNPRNARSAWEIKIFKEIKLRRDSAFQKCRRGPRDRLVGGAKVETFEHLENILSRKKSEAQEEERQQSLDHSAEDQQPSDQRKVHEP
jgi:hypothetical protein